MLSLRNENFDIEQFVLIYRNNCFRKSFYSSLVLLFVRDKRKRNLINY